VPLCLQDHLRKHEIRHVGEVRVVKPQQVPRIMEALNQVWFSMGLVLLLVFMFKVTGLTAQSYGALPAALVFGAISLMVVYAIHFATSRPGPDA